jgi:membrane protease YdiL (CAAX protease family)
MATSNLSKLFETPGMKKLLLFFVLSYFISWITWLPLILTEAGIHGLPVLPEYHHYLGSFGPMIAAFIVKYMDEGRNGTKDLMRQLTRWKVSWTWYAVVIVVPVLLVIAAGYADGWINHYSFSMKGFSTNKAFPQFGPLGYFVFNFLTFGIGEETGWRGYALPVLQKKYPALTATFILAFGWACWHIPAFFYRPLYSQMTAAALTGFFVSLLMGAIVLTWLYNSTKGSLLIVSIFHAMIELMFTSANISVEMSTYLGAAIILAAIMIIIFARPRNLSLQPRQTYQTIK